MEPYVSNPWLYITDNESDFEGEKGKNLKEYFKKVFYSQYKKYSDLIKKNTP